MKKTRVFAAVISLFVIIALLVGCSPGLEATVTTTPTPNAFASALVTEEATSSTMPTETPIPSPAPTQTPSEAVDSISVHFIDVGQADSILIKAGSTAMLIDAGNPNDADLIVNYIQKQGVTKLNYLIGTHPHADHIGSMADIIDKFPIDKILMPDVANNTATFESVLDAVDRKGMVVTVPKAGSKYNLVNAEFTVVAPNASGYDDVNNDSIAIHLMFGSTSFLLVGDAEDVSENEMLSKGNDLTSNLLKVGHHGSNSSSTLPFLKAVKPQYAVISVGKGNTYGHPAEETLAKLTSVGTQILRTDLLGTIVATSDGKNIVLDKKATPIKTTAPPTVSKTSSPAKQTAQATAEATTAPAIKETTKPSGDSTTVYITNTGKKYHRGNCRYLADSKIATTLEQAKADGYTACKVCKPPH